MYGPQGRHSWSVKMTWGELLEMARVSAPRLLKEYMDELKRMESASKKEQNERLFRHWNHHAREQVEAMASWVQFFERCDPLLNVTVDFDDYQFFANSHIAPCDYVDESEEF